MKTLLILLYLLLPVSGQTLQVNRWKAATIEPRRMHEAEQIAAHISANKARYEFVDKITSVPWYVIAGLQQMESGGSFKCHLHEGSPLTGRTRDVPKGRPPAGKPPFTWEESAVDALTYDHMGAVRWTSLDATLYACEGYNGMGYLKFHSTVPTPYLWAGTTIARPGKYTSDGKWSTTAVSSQLGIAAIWKVMIGQGTLNFNKLTIP